MICNSKILQKVLPTACLVVALGVTGSALSTPDKGKQSKFEPVRNAQGHPNMQGTWDFRTLTPLERPTAMADKATFDSAEEEEAYRKRAIALNDVDVQRDSMGNQDVEGAYNAWWMDYGTELNEDRRTSLIVDPPNGRLPDLTPAAYASLKANLKRKQYPVRDILSLQMDNLTFRPEGPEAVGLSERCLLSFNAGPPLMPNAYNNNIRIMKEKRKIIGEEFIRVFEDEAKIGKVDFLVQGTIYPDVIESGTGNAAVIKSHHNVGGLPDYVDFKEIIEPLETF